MSTTKTRHRILRDLNAERPPEMPYGLVVVIDDDNSPEEQAENAIVQWFTSAAEMDAAWSMACALSDSGLSNGAHIKQLHGLDKTSYRLGLDDGVLAILWDERP